MEQHIVQTAIKSWKRIGLSKEGLLCSQSLYEPAILKIK